MTDGQAIRILNPNFSGPGDANGKGTVGTFDWELNYLKFLGVKKELPVFITETGWTHKTDTLETDIGQKVNNAFGGVWSDKRVVAITPFIFKYTEPPFDTFSWENKDGEFYDFYYSVLGLQKISGKPIQENTGDIITGTLPKIAITGSTFHAVLFVKNIGQTIWKINDLGAINGTGERLTIQSMFPSSIEPEQIGVFFIVGEFPNSSGTRDINIVLTSNDKNISNTFRESVIIIPNFPSIYDIWSYLKFLVGTKIGISL